MPNIRIIVRDREDNRIWASESQDRSRPIAAHGKIPKPDNGCHSQDLREERISFI
jgi:hypothetical protein